MGDSHIFYFCSEQDSDRKQEKDEKKGQRHVKVIEFHFYSRVVWLQ